jgi:6-phosphogluconolactonase
VVEIRKAANLQDVAKMASEIIFEEVSRLQQQQEQVDIVLTGGGAGIASIAEFSKRADLALLDLTRVHFWFSDERYVSTDSPDRNANQVREAIAGRFEIIESNFHEFPSTNSGLALSDAANHFENTLRLHFKEEPKFDLTILGMGPDGHVASLFPGKTYQDKLVVFEPDSPKPPAQRLSFSMQMLNSSTKVLFVVAGIDKAEAIEKIHKDPDCDLPASKVHASEETIWIIDTAAGAAFWNC